jgi:8-oxo-dGTP pyrophosphatase MutT (NUDIX family)
MPNSVIPNTAPVRKPMISEEEVHELVTRYGVPIRRVFNIQADEYIRTYRWRADSDRRAEVVFVIQDPSDKIWLHAKSHYPSHIFRLPSGGIHWEESVLEALRREVDEETGLAVEIEDFVGLIEYRFHDNGSTVEFASYIFHVYSDGRAPRCPVGGEISEFRAVLPSQLLQLAVDMRNIIGNRRGWGQWRALAHELVYDALYRREVCR